MTDASAEFFSELGRRGHEPLLEKATGTVGFDLTSGKRTERWQVAIKKGDITVSRKRSDCDCVIRADRELFDRVTTGEVNVMAALLRGTMTFDGDPELAVLFQRLLPGPPGQRDNRRNAGYARRQR